MTYQIHIANTDYKFSAEPNETIVQAAERQGLILPCACRVGSCGACKSQIVSGEVDLGKYQSFALSEADIKSRLALLCVAKAKSDLTIKVRDVKLSHYKVPGFLTKIIDKTEVAPNLIRLVLERENGRPFKFKAGQTYDVVLPGDQRRYYSVASPATQSTSLEFLIHKVPGGLFTSLLFSEGLKIGDGLRLNGPEGCFTFKTPKGRKALFLCTGTGIAPIKSMIQTLIETNDLEGRDLHVYWGVHTSQELVVGKLFEQWAKNHEQIHFTPIVSREEAWKGVKGHVQTQAAIDHGDMTEVDAYLCGNNSMIKAAINFLTVRCGLKDDHIYADSFGG